MLAIKLYPKRDNHLIKNSVGVIQNVSPLKLPNLDLPLALFICPFLLQPTSSCSFVRT